MHRNVVRHLPRQRQQRAPPARTQSFTQQTQHFDRNSNSNSTITEPDDDPSASPSNSKTYTTAEIKTLLQTLDQKTLLETKTHLNAHLTHLQDLKTHLPQLFPTTHPVHLPPPTNEVKPYIVSEYRKHLATLPTYIESASKASAHTRAHIQDLQSENYEEPGDGLAGWKEEVEGMSAEEARGRLQRMRYDEEAWFVRLTRDVKVKGEQMEDIAARGSGGGGVGRRRRGADVDGDVDVDVGDDKVVDGTASTSEKKGKKNEKPPVKQDMGLEALQRQLNESMKQTGSGIRSK